MKTLVATLIGPDKSGLVKQLATLIKQHHGSWQASAMSELAGNFAGIVEIRVPEEHSESLGQALQQLPDFQVQLLEGKQAAQSGQQLKLTVTANDRLGIIDEVTEVLNQFNISVKTLKTDSYPAPTTGTMLFEASSMLTLPHGQTLSDLQARLEALSDDLVVDIDLI
ncbi:glycine cleavage system regulatory protein [Oceanisphaera litoralis]|uniref:glycine cleavage system protein R n=1 Tax=Oceanisphaera litoralis TaxID=225144 RepID=UPI00195E38E2|nr:ACT domain-containing protein [Oceanisphaera litoralis]MBM7454851.1 glycine cleavage system regulatory protein [Oceanisphaera litoralis]